jgi:ribonuclease VapC
MMEKKAYLFDSHALMKYFQKERGYEKVVRLLEGIDKSETAKYINVINLGEIIYATKREFGDQKKLEVLANIERLKFTVLPASNELVFLAAEHKAQYAISYADCFALVSALQHHAIVVTGDPEFEKVKHLVKIVWV